MRPSELVRLIKRVEACAEPCLEAEHEIRKATALALLDIANSLQMIVENMTK